MNYQDRVTNHERHIATIERLQNLGLSYIGARENGEGPELLRCEYAIRSGLHRGYYCPSPVFDLLVGNVKRGRRRHTAKDSEWPNITHCYHFDDSGKMICSEQFLNRILLCTEHLIYSGNTVHGIGIDPRGKLLSVSEEQYIGGKIQSYFYSSFAVMDGVPTCYDTRCETYHYDSAGLCSVDVECFHPQSHIYRCDELVFTRCNGYLSSYQRRNNAAGLAVQCNLTYTPRIKRKADASFAPFRT